MNSSKIWTRERSPTVKAFIRPFNYWYDFYNIYYRESLRSHLEAIKGRYEEISMSRFPTVLRKLRRIRDAYRLQPVFTQAKWFATAIDELGSKLEGPIQSPSSSFQNTTGQYLIMTADGSEYRVCIDSCDYGEIRNADLLAWSDIYFKTNYWPSLSYPPHVAPMVNGDPLVIPQIAQFRSSRLQEKKYDICFIVRVWGGKDEVEGVEHNIRLIEAMAKAKCSKFLLAYLVAGDIATSGRRLERQGIPWSTRPLPAKELWQVSSQSRLNVIRLGMHYCVPWRVTGALAIGSCMVLDRVPLTRWPEPLLVGEHFLDLGAETAPGQSMATDEQYAAIPEKIEAWLADAGTSRRIGLKNGEYFDRFLHPKQVGAHILGRVERLVATGHVAT